MSSAEPSGLIGNGCDPKGSGPGLSWSLPEAARCRAAPSTVAGAKADEPGMILCIVNFPPTIKRSTICN